MLPRLTEQYHNDWYHLEGQATSEAQVRDGLNPADRTFVRSVEDFLAERAPLLDSGHGAGSFLHALSERGWSVPRWPRHWGGAELSPRQAWLLDRTLSLQGAKQLDPVQVDLVGPLLMSLIDDQRLDDWLPAIARGECLWAVHASLQGGREVRGTISADRFFPDVGSLSVSGAVGASRLLLLVRDDSVADIVSAELPAASVTAGALLDPDQVNTRGLVFERLETGQSEQALRSLLENLRTGDALSARSRSGRLRYQLETLRRQAGVSGGVSSTTLAELSVALLALEVLENRSQNAVDESLTLAVTIAGAELGRQLLATTIEALGYYALPAPDPDRQHNELPALAVAGQDAIAELIRYVGGLEEVAARDRVSAITSGTGVDLETR